MAGMSDILTTAQNIVTAIRSVGQTLLRAQGNQTSETVTAATVICTGGGRLLSVSVTVAGSTAGTINNASTTASAAASNVLLAVPATAQVLTAGQSFTMGLVIVPGTGQSLNVTYYQD